LQDAILELQKPILRKDWDFFRYFGPVNFLIVFLLLLIVLILQFTIIGCFFGRLRDRKLFFNTVLGGRLLRWLEQ
jgi:hypothetical protein